MSNSLQAQLHEILEEYSVEVEKATKEAAKEAADYVANDLKNRSPKKAKGKGRGSYARGWKVKKFSQGINTFYVVYNSTSPGLTHVLENGHVIRNQYGSWGRVRAIKHIEPAEKSGVRVFEELLKSKLR